MFTAAKVLSRIEESENIDGLDKWLENFICKKFVESGGFPVTVTTEQVKKQGWKPRAFINAMEERDFIVQCILEQRDGDYYLIHLLPTIKENKELA